MGLKNNWLLSDSIERAQQFASAIVQKRGAVVSDKSFYIDFMKAWEIA
jgi:fructokinase